MRFVLCDDDLMHRAMVESIVTRNGHELIGVADSTQNGVSLVELARPDVLIVDVTIGLSTDFDVIATALDVGAQPIVFSVHAPADVLERYAVMPLVVPKPDFVALENAIKRIAAARENGAGESDRRARPARVASGPVPVDLHDGQAFYEALNAAEEGDTLVAIDVVRTGRTPDHDTVGARIANLIRASDRMLVTASSYKVFLTAGGAEGAASFIDRLSRELDAAPQLVVHSVVVGPQEDPTDAFERLRAASYGGVAP
jgi:chemotaxis response regulator CheB